MICYALVYIKSVENGEIVKSVDVITKTYKAVVNHYDRTLGYQNDTLLMTFGGPNGSISNNRIIPKYI